MTCPTPGNPSSSPRACEQSSPLTSPRAMLSEQPARLRAIPPLAGRDREADRQAEGVHRDVYLGGQAAFGTADTGSFKPPF